MNNNKELGKIGEIVSCKYLENNQYQIIQKNYVCKEGEIDIIAKEKNEYVFIEVKTRKNKKFGYPIDAITNCKKKHIYSSAKNYLYCNSLFNELIRFDVIEVYYIKNKFLIHHLKNVEISR